MLVLRHIYRWTEVAEWFVLQTFQVAQGDRDCRNAVYLYLCSSCCQLEHGTGLTSSETVPVGDVVPAGLVMVPVTVVCVPAGGVAGLAEAAMVTMAGCTRNIRVKQTVLTSMIGCDDNSGLHDRSKDNE